MQREELVKRGVSPNLTHFVIPQGLTVTEHINSLTPEERHEFAEMSRVGPWLIRQAEEYEAQPRELTEANQASI